MSTTHPLVRYRTSFVPKLTQAEMAARFGVTQAFWSYLESGRLIARPALAKKIGAATGIDPDVLMNLTDNDSDKARPKCRRRSRRFTRKSLWV